MISEDDFKKMTCAKMTCEKLTPGCERLAVARPRRTVAAVFCVLLLSGLGWAQTSPSTAEPDDPQCVGQDCPASPGLFGSDEATAPDGNDSPRSRGSLPDTNQNQKSDNRGTSNNPDNSDGDQNSRAKRGRNIRGGALPEDPATAFQEFF